MIKILLDSDPVRFSPGLVNLREYSLRGRANNMHFLKKKKSYSTYSEYRHNTACYYREKLDIWDNWLYMIMFGQATGLLSVVAAAWRPAFTESVQVQSVS